MTTDDPAPWYGAMPGVHPRSKKIIKTGRLTHMDGEDATMIITLGTIAQREAFVDQLSDVICVDGYEGLEELFREWLGEERKRGFKSKESI